jgi:hypothetical protein
MGVCQSGLCHSKVNVEAQGSKRANKSLVGEMSSQNGPSIDGPENSFVDRLPSRQGSLVRTHE